MDRNINYTGQILYEKDILNTNKFGYVALSRIFDAIVGKNTVFNRLDCVPATVPNLTVDVETGEIYFAEETDTTPYGVLPVDTTIITKQGIFPEKTNFPTPAPIGAGNSINYLIEFKFETADTDIENRPYFNSASPSNPILQNAANFRSDKCLAQIITGVEAPTGTQVTPPVTAGWFGGWVITVNFGDTAVNSSAISKYPSAVFIEERLLDLAEVSPTPQKNIIIGGNFDTNPWQRNTSATNIYAAHTASGLNVSFPAPDRFGVFGPAITGDMSISRVLNAPSVTEAGIYTRYACRYEVTTAQASFLAADLVGTSYIVEGFDWAQLAQNPAAFQLWVYTNKVGKYDISFENGGQDRTLVHPFTVTNPDTWQRIPFILPPSLDGTWEYESGVGLAFGLHWAVGSNFHGPNQNTWQPDTNFSSDHVNFFDTIGNRFDIALIKLESGAVSTPWKQRTAAEELALCQRYYRESLNLGEIAGQPNSGGTYGMRNFDASSTPHILELGANMRPESAGNPHIVSIYSTTTGAGGSGAAARIRNVTQNLDFAPDGVGQSETNIGVSTTTAAGDLQEFYYTFDSEIR